MNSLLSKIIADNKNVVLCLALIALAGYAIVLPTSFKTMDDLVSIVNNPRIKSISQLGEIFRTSFFTENAYYRPLVLVSFMVEYHLFGLRAFFYNMNNLLLHIANAFLGFLIVASLLKDRRLAFLSAALFVLHPAHWEAVSNIPGRSILLCSFFFLLAVHLFIKGEQDQRTGVSTTGAVACFGLALLSKESAVMLPFCLAAYYFFINGKLGRRQYMTLLPYAIVLAVYFLLRQAMGITSVAPWDSPAEVFVGISTFLGVCLYYARQIILPVNFYYDHT
ncbi:MAG: glycosyltransferase family 39 protein, partial [Candidatus Omnitrophica bacterium]|nr:glycosyltransferase family 39 protein [Candidatus Omnitrophota bacterium]